MNNFPAVNIFESLCDLVNVVFCFEFSNSFSSFEKIIQGLELKSIYLRSADLQQNIDVFFVFEKMLKVDDVLVAQGLVDFYLGLEFFFGLGFGEGSFFDDFGCVFAIGLFADEFVALGKATLHDKKDTFPNKLPLI